MDKPLDLSRYEGHTPGDWQVVMESGELFLTHNDYADVLPNTVENMILQADAPALLAEVKQLRAECAVLREAVDRAAAFGRNMKPDEAGPVSAQFNKLIDAMDAARACVAELEEK